MSTTPCCSAGAAAWTLEQAVIAKIRRGRRLSSYLTSLQMQGVGGFTETFNAIDLPPADLRDIAEAEELQLTSNEQAGFAFRD
jgi:hypothetical protein